VISRYFSRSKRVPATTKVQVRAGFHDAEKMGIVLLTCDDVDFRACSANFL
jgi:hypothetical protein